MASGSAEVRDLRNGKKTAENGEKTTKNSEKIAEISPDSMRFHQIRSKSHRILVETLLGYGNFRQKLCSKLVGSVFWVLVWENRNRLTRVSF